MRHPHAVCWHVCALPTLKGRIHHDKRRRDVCATLERTRCLENSAADIPIPVEMEGKIPLDMGNTAPYIYTAMQ